MCYTPCIRPHENENKAQNVHVSVFDEYGPPPVHIDGQLEFGEDTALGEDPGESRPPEEASGRHVLTVQQVVEQRLNNH